MIVSQSGPCSSLTKSKLTISNVVSGSHELSCCAMSLVILIILLTIPFQHVHMEIMSACDPGFSVKSARQASSWGS